LKKSSLKLGMNWEDIYKIMKQPRDLLNIETFQLGYNYSCVQVFKYLCAKKEYWSREELDNFFTEVLNESLQTRNLVYSIFKNSVPHPVLINIVEHCKTLLIF